MVSIGRQPVRSNIPAAPTGRREPARRAAVLLTAACAAAVASLMSALLLPPTAYGTAGPTPAMRASTSTPTDRTLTPTGPGVSATTTLAGPSNGPTTGLAGNPDPVDPTAPTAPAGPRDTIPAIPGGDLPIGRPPGNPGSGAPDHAWPTPVEPTATDPAGAGSRALTGEPTTTPHAGTNLGLDLGFNADPGNALRAPDLGSQPSLSPVAGTPDAEVANESPGRWNPLHRAATGQWLFLTGFLLLVLSIGGLATVGVYRRRW